MPSIYEKRDYISEFFSANSFFCFFFAIITQLMRFPFNRSNLAEENLSKYEH